MTITCSQELCSGAYFVEWRCVYMEKETLNSNRTCSLSHHTHKWTHMQPQSYGQSRSFWIGMPRNVIFMFDVYLFVPLQGQRGQRLTHVHMHTHKFGMMCKSVKLSKFVCHKSLQLRLNIHETRYKIPHHSNIRKMEKMNTKKKSKHCEKLMWWLELQN